MSTFVANEVVERIRWDFTKTPSVDKGKHIEHEQLVGELVEPDHEQTTAFLEAYERFLDENVKAARASFARERELDRRAAGYVDDEDVAGEPVAEVISAGDLYGLACEIGQEALVAIGVPDDLVLQLPPRVLLAFMRHVNKELSGEGAAASSNG